VRAIHFAFVRAWLDTRNQHIVRRPLIYSPVSKKPSMKLPWIDVVLLVFDGYAVLLRGL
jgi:hypothetical protein